MPTVRTSKEVWNFVMGLVIKTGEPTSIVMDKLLAEAMKNAKCARTEGGNKKRDNGGSEEWYLGIEGLTK